MVVHLSAIVRSIMTAVTKSPTLIESMVYIQRHKEFQNDWLGIRLPEYLHVQKIEEIAAYVAPTIDTETYQDPEQTLENVYNYAEGMAVIEDMITSNVQDSRNTTSLINILEDMIYHVRNGDNKSWITKNLLLKRAEYLASQHKISPPKARYSVFHREASKDRNYIIASRKLYSQVFGLYKNETMSTDQVLKLGKRLINNGYLYDRDALFYMSTKKYLDYYNIDEVIRRWSEFSLVDNCLSGGDLLFGRLLDPNTKLSPKHRRHCIQKVISNYEKLVPSTAGYAQFIVSLITANEIDDAGILMSRLSIPGDDFIRPIKELLFEPDLCNVNLVHIAQFAELLIRCIKNDRQKKKAVKIKQKEINVQYCPETGHKEEVNTEKSLFINVKIDQKRVFKGDGKVGYLLNPMRVSSAFKEKKLKDQGQAKPKGRRYKYNAYGMHRLVQEVANVWITLIETQLTRRDDHNPEVLAEMSFNEFLKWRADYRPHKKKLPKEEKPIDDSEAERCWTYKHLKINTLRDESLKKRIVTLAERFKKL